MTHSQFEQMWKMTPESDAIDDAILPNEQKGRKLGEAGGGRKKKQSHAQRGEERRGEEMRPTDVKC